ncbi:hypothetical protein B0H16DRAFT_1566006, partial [Mycena metata]
MSDAGGDMAIDAPVAEEAPKGKLSVEDALQGALSLCYLVSPENALVHDGLARSLRKCTKALDKRQAHLCVLVRSIRFTSSRSETPRSSGRGRVSARLTARGTRGRLLGATASS